MKHILAPVAALLISVSILLAGQGLQGTLLPVRASLENFPTLAIGIMGAAYFLGFTLGCLRGGELVQRVGHVRVFLAMTALASAAPLLHGLVLNPIAWGLLLMYGIGAIAGSFIASLFMSYIGAVGLFGFSAIVHSTLAIFVLHRMLQGASTPDERHMAYPDALATAHTASHVYEKEYQQHAEFEDQHD